MKFARFFRILDYLPFLREKRPKQKEEILEQDEPTASQAALLSEEAQVNRRERKKPVRIAKKQNTFKRQPHRNKVFASHRYIRAALKELRDVDKKIIDYQEEIKPNSLLYQITLRKDKPFLTTQFIHPHENWRRYESAQNLQIFLKDFLSVIEIKKIILRKIDNRLRGWEAEDAVVAAAKDLSNQPGSKVIDAYHASNYEDGRKQIDVIVVSFFEEVGRHELPLQVKTSLKGQEEHIAKESLKGDQKRIPSIQVNTSESRESLQKKIIIIRDACYKRNEILHL